MIKVIRYANRKLYIAKRGYITGKDLVDMIESHVEFQIINSETSEDVTVETVAVNLALSGKLKMLKRWLNLRVCDYNFITKEMLEFDSGL